MERRLTAGARLLLLLVVGVVTGVVEWCRVTSGGAAAAAVVTTVTDFFDETVPSDVGVITAMEGVEDTAKRCGGITADINHENKYNFLR